jgi:predicted molibdopterin-dependent oxidoreductase YjgC
VNPGREIRRIGFLIPRSINIDHEVSYGHLCVQGRFGFEFVQRRAREP